MPMEKLFWVSDTLATIEVKMSSPWEEGFL